MTDIFKTDLREMQAFAKWARSNPRGLRVAGGMMLNQMAFGSKEEIGKVIEGEFTLRKPKWVLGRIRVQKAVFSQTIDLQVSAVGAIQDKPRFSSLVEQQTGDRAKRKATASIRGRSGSKRKKIAPSARFRKRHPEATNFPVAGSPNRRVMIALNVMAKQGFKTPFVIRGHKQIPDGLYRFIKGKTSFGQRRIGILRRFDKDRAQPKRFKWLTIGVKRYFARHNQQREWIRIGRRVVNKTWGKK